MWCRQAAVGGAHAPRAALGARLGVCDVRRRRGLLQAVLSAVAGVGPDNSVAGRFVAVACGVGGPASPWAECEALDLAWRQERSRRWKEWGEADSLAGGFSLGSALRRGLRRAPNIPTPGCAEDLARYSEGSALWVADAGAPGLWPHGAPLDALPLQAVGGGGVCQHQFVARAAVKRQGPMGGPPPPCMRGRTPPLRHWRPLTCWSSAVASGRPRGASIR